MAGMEALGRLFNVIPIAAGQPFKFRSASVVTFVVTGATAQITLTQDSTFGGAFSTAAPVIKNVYWTTAANGTAAWSKLTFVNGVAPFGSGPLSTFTLGTTVGLTTATCAVCQVFTSELADPFSYIKATMAGGGLVQAILGDLVHQRGPANLEILAS